MVAVVVNQNNFMEVLSIGSIQDTMNRSKEDIEFLIVETDDDTGRR